MASTPQQITRERDDNPMEEIAFDDAKEKQPTAHHVESTPSDEALANTRGESGMTRAKWLACIALGTAYTTAFQQNACTATIIKHIDEELGPTDHYNWMLSAYTIAVAVSLPLAGGLSDIFGRRYFFIVGCFISLIGTIVAVAAKDVNTVIGGMVLKGVGGASQQLALAAVAELVPNKHRGNAQAVLDILILPWTMFGALTGGAMVKYQDLSFRINWYVGIILNVLAIVMTYFWYYPPAYVKIVGKTKWQQVKELDWIGVFLLAVGITLTLCGIAFGDAFFPWKHAGVIAPLVIGVLALFALGVWEWKLAPRPFLQKQLFKGRGRTFSLVLCITFVTGMGLYAAAAFWTQQVQSMWDRDPVRIGILTIPGGFGGAVGGFAAGMLIGKHRLLKTNLCLVYGCAVKTIADGFLTTLTPETLQRALGLGFVSMVATGWTSVSLIVCVQLACDDRNIGLATLLLGSMRAIGGSVAITVYTTLLHSRVVSDSGPRVAKAVLPMGFKAVNLKPLITNISAGKVAEAIKLPDATPAVLEATVEALKWSYGEGFKAIFTAATVFAGTSFVAACFVKDVSHNMTENVAVRLDNEREQGKEAV